MLFSSKVLKLEASVLTPIITNLFNDCIEQAVLPDEWKMAIVTPIYKNKGSNEDMNNYRGISVISPIAKIFEKILATQIITYLNSHNILFKGQHGFRSEHSCETALHELLSDMNMIRSLREIGIFLFIDFRKAFDLVDPDLLILKLKLYGFHESALNLIKNYFTNRSQKVKFGGFLSMLRQILLSVPQGSIIGPLFFLIFINDMAYFMKNMKCVLFADDTTLYKSGNDLNKLIDAFKQNLTVLEDWCLNNRLDINWSKTFIMFITNKRVQLPVSIDIGNKNIEVVSSFKLLGIEIDNKLNFSKYIGEIRKTINMKIHSIKRLFYLSTPVKIQFFKTFILPCFDYCSTLAIYIPKRMIQKIANCYNQCLYKLIGFNFEVKISDDFNKLNDALRNYKLANYQHRILNRMMLFIHKMLNSQNGPKNLIDSFTLNSELDKSYALRNINNYEIPAISNLNNYGKNTFTYFFSKFLNKVCKDSIRLVFNQYKTITSNNINNCFNLFVEHFEIFDLNYIKYNY